MTLLKQLTAKATQAVAVLQLVTRAVAVSLCCRWWSLTCARCHRAAHEHMCEVTVSVHTVEMVCGTR